MSVNYSWIPIIISESLISAVPSISLQYFSVMNNIILQHLLSAFLLYWYCAYLRLYDMLILSAFLLVFDYSLFVILCCEAPLWWFSLGSFYSLLKSPFSFILFLPYSNYLITVLFNLTIYWFQVIFDIISYDVSSGID